MENEIEYKGFTLKIERDDNPENPREWDNMGKMACSHRKYVLGDKNESIDNAENAFLKLPLFLYDHGGIAMSTGDFGDQWDSGQVGWIYCSRKDILDNFMVKRITKSILERAKKNLIGEVKTYDDYLQGNVYGYIVSKNGETIDSCWGYYDNDAEIEGKQAIDYYSEKERKEKLEKTKAYIKNHVPLNNRLVMA